MSLSLMCLLFLSLMPLSGAASLNRIEDDTESMPFIRNKRQLSECSVANYDKCYFEPRGYNRQRWDCKCPAGFQCCQHIFHFLTSEIDYKCQTVVDCTRQIKAPAPPAIE